MPTTPPDQSRRPPVGEPQPDPPTPPLDIHALLESLADARPRDVYHAWDILAGFRTLARVALRQGERQAATELTGERA